MMEKGKAAIRKVTLELADGTTMEFGKEAAERLGRRQEAIILLTEDADKLKIDARYDDDGSYKGADTEGLLIAKACSAKLMLAALIGLTTLVVAEVESYAEQAGREIMFGFSDDDIENLYEYARTSHPTMVESVRNINEVAVGYQKAIEALVLERSQTH